MALFYPMREARRAIRSACCYALVMELTHSSRELVVPTKVLANSWCSCPPLLALVSVRSAFTPFFLTLCLFSLALVPASPLVRAQDAGPPAVVVMTARLAPAAEAWEFAGRVVAINSQDVIARVQGFLVERVFEEGQLVEQGDLLFRIERAQFEAERLAAAAAVDNAAALFREREMNYERMRDLDARSAVSKTQLDAALADKESAAAALRGAKAQLGLAELRLGYTEIRAAHSGRVGNAAIATGNLVDQSTGPLARVVQLDPVRIEYAISDREYLDARSAQPDVPQEELNQGFMPRIMLANGEAYREQGRVVFVDNEINPRTGTLSVWAEFPNPQRILLPGQTLRVQVERNDVASLPVVPRRAVVRTRDGTFLYVVDDDGRVEQRTITAQPAGGEMVAVSQGLAEGEKVIVEGLQKISPGSQVIASELLTQ